jgi:predicted PurR-regulated permease PerM
MVKRGPLIVLAVLLAVLLIPLLQMARPFASSFILASILATAMHSANNRLSRRLRRPALASLLLTFATLTALGTTLLFVGVVVTKELANTYNASNQTSLAEGGWAEVLTHRTDQVVDALATRFPIAKESIRTKLHEGMDVAARYLAAKARAAIGGLASMVVTVVFAVIFLYFLLRYGELWLSRVTALIPLDPNITSKLFRTAHQSIVANMNGVLVVALAQGLFLSLGFWFVGIRSPLLWGMLGAIASIVPFVGTALIWVPAVIGLFIMGLYWKALALGIWSGLVVGSVDNVLRPLVVGAREKQHPVLTGFAMLGGTYAFGPLGLLIGPLVISLTGQVIEEMRSLEKTA